jgi:acetylornithine deacetylase
VLANNASAGKMTAAKAIAYMEFPDIAKVDPAPILSAVREPAGDVGIEPSGQHEGFPPELPAAHPMIALAPNGSGASELKRLAPCVMLGPGDVAHVHTPCELMRALALHDVVPLFGRLPPDGAASVG